MKREPGFYWVKPEGDGWNVAYFSVTSTWWMVGDEFQYSDKNFEEIDENKITRSQS